MIANRRRIRVSLHPFMLSALVATVVACRGNDRVPASDVASGVSRSDSASVGASTAIDTSMRPDPNILLALDDEGLRVVVAQTGSTRLIAFGSDSVDILDVVARSLGAPKHRGSNAECGAGAMDFASYENGLSINLQSGHFVGWSVRPSSSANTLTTMNGVGVGSSRAALDSAFVNTVTTTSLGEEFSSGALSGVLDKAGPTGRITNMWAGVNCIAR